MHYKRHLSLSFVFLVGCESNGENGGATEAATATTGMSMGATGSSGVTDEPTVGSPICGDGIVQAPEACDDGDQAAQDGCELDCTPTARLIWEVWPSGWWQQYLSALCIDNGGDVALGAGVLPFESLDASRLVVSFTDAGVEKWRISQNGLEPENLNSSGSVDRLNAVAIDPMGRTIVCGDEHDAEVTDWVAAYGNNGELAWEHKEMAPMPGVNNECLGVVAGEAAVYAVGQYVKTQMGGSERTGWVAKWDPKGTVLWQRELPIVASLSASTLLIVPSAQEEVVLAGGTAIHAISSSGDYLGAAGGTSDDDYWSLLGRTETGFAAIQHAPAGTWGVLFSFDGNIAQIDTQFDLPNDSGDSINYVNDIAGNIYMISGTTITKYSATGGLQWVSPRIAPDLELLRPEIAAMNADGRLVVAGETQMHRIYLQAYTLQ